MPIKLQLSKEQPRAPEKEEPDTAKVLENQSRIIKELKDIKLFATCVVVQAVVVVIQLAFIIILIAKKG